MKNKFLGLTLTAVFSLSLVTSAYAGDHNKKDKKAKTSYEQMQKKARMNQDINRQVISGQAETERMMMDSESNPFSDSSVEGSGSALSFENNYDYIGVTSATGAALLDEKKRQEMMKQERLNKEMKDKQLMNPNESTDFQAQNKSIYDSESKDRSMENTTTGSAIVVTDDVGNINILERYNARAQNCADELSRVNGELIKNDAFYACQRYKIN